MIEFITEYIGEITDWFMFVAVVSCYYALYLQKKTREKLFKEYKELADEHENVLLRYWTQSVEILSLCKMIETFVEEHNSWHDRKIAFYYDKDGWHCLYADEIPQGNVVTEQEEINAQNEKEDENN